VFNKLTQTEYDNYSIATIGDLVEVAGQKQVVINPTDRGWKFMLPSNQKVLSDSITFNNEVFFVLNRICPAKLGMQICGVFRDFGQRVVYLIIQPHLFIVDVFHRHAALFSEWHGPVAVQCTAGINAYGQRRYLFVVIPADSKEIPNRNFDRRLGFIIPVETQNRITPVPRRRHPYLLNCAWTLDLCKCEGGTWFDPDKGIHLSSLTKISGSMSGRPFFQGSHASLAFFTGKIFRADGTCTGI